MISLRLRKIVDGFLAMEGPHAAVIYDGVWGEIVRECELGDDAQAFVRAVRADLMERHPDDGHRLQMRAIGDEVQVTLGKKTPLT